MQVNVGASDSLSEWLVDGEPNMFPYVGIIDEIRSTGKHFTSPGLISELLAARAQLQRNDAAGQDLRRFLDIALDKVDGTYNYITYLAIDVMRLDSTLNRVRSLEDAQHLCDDVVIRLILDAVHFETRVQKGEQTYLPLRVPESAMLNRRCDLALKAIRPHLSRRLGTSSASACLAELRERHCRPGSTADGSLDDDQLERTMLPVYRVHDEHMFLRVLQSFETVFTCVAWHLQISCDLFLEDPAAVCCHLRAASQSVEEASRLFLFLATMSPESFRDFRQYTEGASAIQSRNYKNVEALCRRPDDDRLNSIAYTSVPDVQSRITEGRPSLDACLEAAERDGIHSAGERENIRDAMSHFAAVLTRWKHAHYGIAVRMLGKGRGTGYTEGTPYLKTVRQLPVFNFAATAANADIN